MSDNSGEIRVDLRLGLDKMRQDLARGLAELKQQMAHGMKLQLGDAAPEAKRAGDEVEKLVTKVQRVKRAASETTSELQKQLAAWREMNKGGVQPGGVTFGTMGGQASVHEMKGERTLFPQPEALGFGRPQKDKIKTRLGAIKGEFERQRLEWEKDLVEGQRTLAANIASGRHHGTMTGALLPGGGKLPFNLPPGQAASPGTNWSAFLKNIGFSTLPLANPTSMLANLASWRQSFTAFQTKAGQGILGGFGLTGTSGAAIGATAITGAAAAAGLALMGLRKAAIETTEAFARAAHLYSTVLRGGGMAAGWQIHRQNIAGVLGVSEQEVMRVSRAFQELSERTRYASQVLTQTMPVLAGTTQNWRIMMLQVNAFFAKMAETLGPVVSQLINFNAALMQVMTSSTQWAAIGKAIAVTMAALTAPAMALQLALAGLNVALTAAVEGIRYMAIEVNNMLAKWHVPGFKARAQGGFPNTAAGLDGLQKMWAAMTGRSPETAPPAVPDVKRLPGSWAERMGLVIGAGSGSDYPRQTAHATRATAEHLQALRRLAERTTRPTIGLVPLPNHH